MTKPRPDLRARKRQATRQAISDVATRLFFEKGFESVTVDQIAAAADVGRMTVFNHFPRKEDLFFDQDAAAREILLDAIRQRDPAVTPIETLRRLAHRLVAEDRAFIRFFDGSRRFVETVRASETLQARARAIRDEVVFALATALAASVGRPADDAEAHLAASLTLAGWSAAFIEAHAVFRRAGDGEAAKATFLDIADRGSVGVAAAMVGTPYGERA